LQELLAIEIGPGVAPGQYSFEIGLKLDGEDRGALPAR
jgi:hypothetical protein